MARTKKNDDPAASAVPTGCDQQDQASGCAECPVVAVLLAYFTDKYGNDSRPKIIQDLKALNEGKE